MPLGSVGHHALDSRGTSDSHGVEAKNARIKQVRVDREVGTNVSPPQTIPLPRRAFVLYVNEQCCTEHFWS